MSHAMHRIPAKPTPAHRPPSFSVLHPLHAWSQPSNRAAAAQVLEAARAFCHAGPSAANGRAPAPADEGFEAAVRLYEAGHWEQAFVNLAALADLGHAPAAKLALLMLRYGATVYGSTFIVHPGQVARWAQRVLRANPRPSSRATASPSSITASA
jgi:hypothetical protein